MRVFIFVLAGVPLIYTLYGDQAMLIWRMATRRVAPVLLDPGLIDPGQRRLRMLDEALAARPDMGWARSGVKAPPPVHRDLAALAVTTDGSRNRIK